MTTKGKVKWFNDTKGYGFITTDDNKDVFLHHADIIAEGYRTASEGDYVSFDLVEGKKGWIAKNVTVVKEEKRAEADNHTGQPDRPRRTVGDSPNTTSEPGENIGDRSWDFFICMPRKTRKRLLVLWRRCFVQKAFGSGSMSSTSK